MEKTSFLITFFLCIFTIPILCFDHSVTNNNVSSPRIVGGEKANLSEVPFMVSLLIRKTSYHSCAATLIRPDVVLTAAHCVYGLPKKDVKFNVGSSKTSIIGTLIDPQRIQIHEGYDNDTFEHDVALVFLKSDVLDKVPGTKLVKLSRKTPAVGEPLMAYGWGYIKHGGPLSIDLMKVQLHTISYSYCKQIYKNIGIAIVPNIFCTHDKNKDTCSGDSGGPLLNKDGEQVGIVSSGTKCAIYPGINVDVNSEFAWIEDKLKAKVL